MTKASMDVTKYTILGNFEVNGYIDKPDLIGSFFGQTEGLIGEDLDFSELQKKGKLGRIEIKIKKLRGKTKGEFIIPTALSKVEVSLVAAAIESINKISHASGKITITCIRDEREDKRKFVIKRAEEILKSLNEKLPESSDITTNIEDNFRKSQIKQYPGELFGGPNIENEDELILVEGRADVVNLVKHGYLNVICFNGSGIPNFIKKITKNKTIIAFLDDDKGGRDELDELRDTIVLKYYTFAPDGKEVEDLNIKEINKALKNKIEYKREDFNKNNFKTPKEEKGVEEEQSGAKKIVNRIKDSFSKNIPKSKEIAKEGIEKINTEIDRFQKNVLYKDNNNNNNTNINTKTSSKNKDKAKNTSKIKKSENKDKLFLKKGDIEKIQLKIKQMDKSGKKFNILNNDLRIIKSGSINDFLKIQKSNNAKYLILDGVCENSVLKKSKELNVKIIIANKINSKAKDNNIIIKSFTDINTYNNN